MIDRENRKEYPMATGLLDFFPDALAEVAHVSLRGCQQHREDGDLHWDPEVSPDNADALIRHLADRGTRDNDGVRHSAKVAWRALALLQLELEWEDEECDPKASSDTPEIGSQNSYIELGDETAAIVEPDGKYRSRSHRS